MNHHNHLRMRLWMVLVGIIVLIAGHGVILYYVSAHTTLPAAIVSGVIVLVVLKHLGFLGALYGGFRRRYRQK